MDAGDLSAWGSCPLVLTLALRRQDPSPRWKEIVEPAPGRLNHHLELYSAIDIDGEICARLITGIAWPRRPMTVPMRWAKTTHSGNRLGRFSPLAGGPVCRSVTGAPAAPPSSRHSPEVRT
jgi:hypothetical protein